MAAWTLEFVMALFPFRFGGLGGFGARAKTPAFGALDASKTVREAAANAGPVQLDANVTLANPDGTGFGGGRLTVSIAGATAADSFSIREADGITVAGNGVYYQGTRIGTVTSDGAAGSALTVAFDSGPVSNQAATALARSVSYSSTSDAPGAAARAVTFQAVDAEKTAGAARMNLKIAADRDAPQVSGLDAHMVRTPQEALTARLVDGDVTVRNPDGTGFSGGSLNVHLDGATAGDDLTLASGPFRIQGTKVFLGATHVANVTASGQDGTDLTIKFKAAAKVSDAQMTQLMEQVAHSTSDAAPPEGERTLTFTLTDKEGDVTRASVGLTVAQPNRAPVATDDARTTAEDTPLVVSAADLLANDGDLDGDTLSIIGFGGASGGTLVYSGGTFTFTPAADYSGPASFTYTVSDGKGGTDTATVNVTVTPVNDAPVAADDERITLEDRPLVITVAELLANDGDMDGDPLSVTGVGGAVGGTVALEDGEITFTPDADYNGPASFTYTVSDGKGGTDTATVNLTVWPVNDAPVITSGATATFAENATGTVYQIAASDVEGDALTYTLTGFDADLFTVDADGKVTFKAAPDFEAPADAGGDNVYGIAVQVSDGTTTTTKAVAITVTDVAENATPRIVAVYDPAVTLVEAARVGNGSSNGYVFSPDGTKVLFRSYASNLVEGDTNNSTDVFVKDLGTGAVTLVNSSSSGTPGNGWSQGYQFSPDGTKVLFYSSSSNLVAGDTNGTTDVFVKDLGTGAVTLVNSSSAGVPGDGWSDGIQFSPDGTKVLFQSYSSNLVDGDTNGTYDVFVKELETGAVTLVSSSSSGMPGNTDSYGYQFSPDGSKVLFYSYASNLVEGDTNGTYDVFVKDLATGELTLVSANAAYGTPLSLSGFLTFEDDDAADIHTVSVTPADGTIGTLVAIVVPVADGPDRVEYVYQADRDAFLALQVGETKTETFTLLIDDGNGGTVSHDVVVTLAGTNRAPDAADDAFELPQDYALEIGNGGGSGGSGGGGDRIAPPAGTWPYGLSYLLGNDTDPNGDPLTITAVGDAVNGVVSLDDQGRIQFLPDDGFYGEAAFTYTVSDGRGGTDTATVTVDVIKANTAPTDLVLSNATVAENLAGETVGVLSATDADGDALSYSIRPGGDGALFTLEGNVLRVGYEGFDFEASATRSVTVRATDSRGAYTEETFTIDVLDRPETVLTTGPDVFEGTAADEQVYANSYTLNPEDQLSGGDGYDILFVSASLDTLNLATPAAFSGFEEVRLGGSWGGLWLRDGTDLRVVSTGWGNSIYLSTGRENISGGSDSEYFIADRVAELSDGDVLDGGGGTDSLRVSGGGTFDLTVPDIDNIEVLYIESSTTARVEDEALSGFLDIYGSAGSLLVTGADSLDLTGKTLHNVAVTSDNASGTVFTIDRAANTFFIQGGPGNDTLVANGVTYTDEQRALIFATTSIETIQDSSGTYVQSSTSAPFSSSLTTTSDVVTAFAANQTVYGTAATLNAGDALAAGEGHDTLVLAGSGTFDLSTLAGFSGFEEVRLVNDFDSASSTLILRDGIDLTITGSAHSTSFHLSTGADKIFGGNGGNTFYTTAPEDLTAADELHGGTGSDTLYLQGYAVTYDLRGMQTEGIEILGIQGGTAIVDSDVLTDVTSIYSYDGGTLSTPDAELDLRGVGMDPFFGGVRVLSTNATGTTFIVDSADAAGYVQGGDGVDTLIVSGLSLTDSQRQSTFTYRSVEIIRDASGVYGDETANALVGTAAAEIISGGGGADVLTGGAGGDTFVLSTEAGARITDFNAVGGLVADDDILDIGALISASSFVAGDDLADFVWLQDADGDAGTSSAYVMYDADGAGAGAAVQHTQLDGLNAGDTLHLAHNGTTTDLMVIL